MISHKLRVRTSDQGNVRRLNVRKWTKIVIRGTKRETSKDTRFKSSVPRVCIKRLFKRLCVRLCFFSSSTGEDEGSLTLLQVEEELGQWSRDFGEPAFGLRWGVTAASSSSPLSTLLSTRSVARGASERVRVVCVGISAAAALRCCCCDHGWDRRLVVSRVTVRRLRSGRVQAGTWGALAERPATSPGITVNDNFLFDATKPFRLVCESGIHKLSNISRMHLGKGIWVTFTFLSYTKQVKKRSLCMSSVSNKLVS